MTHLPSPAHPRAPQGLTLLEVLIAIGLLTLVVGSLTTFYFISLEQRDRGLRITDRARLARVVLDQMASELRRITPYRKEHAQPVEGELGEVQFVMNANPARGQFRAPQYDQGELLLQADVMVVKYRVKADWTQLDEAGKPKVLGLYRTVTRSPGILRPGQGGGTAVEAAEQAAQEQQAQLAEAETPEQRAALQAAALAEGAVDAALDGEVGRVSGPQIDTLEERVSEQVKYLRVRYSDASGWQPKWPLEEDNPFSSLTAQRDRRGRPASSFQPEGIPLAIEVTIGFEPDHDLLAYMDGKALSSGEEAPADAQPFAYDASTSASVASESTPHPDRFALVVTLPMAEKVFTPFAGQLKGKANSLLGDSAISDFMQKGFDLGGGLDLQGGGSRGAAGGQQGPAGPLFGGQGEP